MHSKPLLKLILLCVNFVFLMCSVQGNHNRPSITAAFPDSSGIYLTLDDFLHKQLAIAYECGTKRSRMRIHEKPQVSIVKNSVRHKFQLNDIFGFRKCGIDYRAYAERHFQILSTGTLFVYKYTYEEQVGNNFRTAATYHFSEAPGSAIFPLTRHYLKWVFRSNEKFVRDIDSSFVNDGELIRFDTTTSMYAIEKVLLQSGN